MPVLRERRPERGAARPAWTPSTLMAGEAARLGVTTFSMLPLGTKKPAGPNTSLACGTRIQPPAITALTGPPPGTAGSA